VGLLASSLMGFGVSLYLGRQHHAAAGTSVCSVNEVFNCDDLNRSAWSEIAGVPIAFLGSAFYAGVIALVVMSLQSKDGYQRHPWLIFGSSVLAVLYSLVLAGVSAHAGTWCLFCISMYGVNLLLLIGSYLSTRDEPGTGLMAGVQQAFTGADRSLGTASVTALAVLIGSLAWYRSLGPAEGSASAGTDPQAADFDIGQLYSPWAPVTIDGTEPVLGSPSARYTVVEFADFECPFCGRIAPALADMVQKNPDIKVLFKNYPLSNVCNDQISDLRHENACPAAAAGECGRQQGKFWELDHLMFKNQDYLDNDGLRFMARQAGVDMEAFESCMADPRTEAAIRADVAHAVTAGVEGTPTLYATGFGAEGEWIKVEGHVEETLLLVQAHRAAGSIPPSKRPRGPSGR
jgi:protein-disulfide isomerase/uncharacterized membrane protein